MVHRTFWTDKIERFWEKRGIIWLTGVRRAGKTFLCMSLPDIEYFDCELPRVRRLLEDPERFLKEFRRKRIVLDEIHRLKNPSELLKIAADYFPTIKVIATGSSTLQTSVKFRDTLTGRKLELWLTPLTSRDMEDFKIQDLNRRLNHGGLPSFFLAPEFPEGEIQEWVDSYWSKDIQELFHLQRRHSFQKFFELLMAQSGGIFEATRFAHECEVSRPTIMNYLNILASTNTVTVVRPFSTRRSTEIISAPKVYGFDTGFSGYYKGWKELRPTDLGMLWELFVLNELQATTQRRDIQYWRDKRGHEVDIVVARRSKAPVAIECKWSGKDPDLSNITAFARHYPKAVLWLVAPDIDRPYDRPIENGNVRYSPLSSLITSLTTHT